MKLLYTKRSPYARKVRVMALEKKIPLELVEVDLTKKSDELLKANPLGKIPTLILDNGEALADSPVICEYIESLNPKPEFIPKDAKKRLRVLHIQAIADGLMDNSVAAYMEKQRHPDNFHAQFIANQERAIDQGLKFFADNLGELQKFNLASVAAAAAIGYINFRLPHAGPAAKYPKLNKWFEEFSKRPSLTQTVPG